MNIKPLAVKVSRCVISGQMYDLLTYEEYVDTKEIAPNTAILTKFNDKDIVLPIKGNYNGQTTPGVYNAGCIDFVIKPTTENVHQYTPSKIIEMSNNTAMKDILERKDILARLDEPWITSPDNITQFTITDEDRPEMRCLKTALNKKKIDIDKYAPRFGDNFPNDKRQLKNNGATLNIIKRFCKCLDMEALMILRDKNPNVPNPIGSEILVSLTDEYFDEEESS